MQNGNHIFLVLLDIHGPFIPRSRKMYSNINDNPILPFFPSECHIRYIHLTADSSLQAFPPCKVQAWFGWGTSEEKATGQML